ncbi:MAG: Zn-dependent hydrolase [Bacteroidota bacterium]
MKLFRTITIGMILTILVSNSGKCFTSAKDSLMQQKIEQFAVVKLTTDLTKLSVKEKEMLPILIEVADIMDEIFWMQTLGDKTKFLSNIKEENTRKFALINYGPWERLNENKSFVDGFKKKPDGANYYPKDMTKEEFAKFADKNKTSLYTLIRRNNDKTLKCVWFHQEYKEKVEKAAKLLEKAAFLAEDAGLRKYLQLRAKALLTDDYFESDMAWMDMKDNKIDMVVGPIETYEDGLYGYKAAQEAAILIKDKDWSNKLSKYAALLPKLQTELPVDAKYKKEVPGTSSDMNVYDIVYYAGHANSGGKTIAINLPNDEKVQAAKGSRRLQLKNAMKAKFDNILIPIANQLIDPTQIINIKFEAFFANVMFHEVAHGLGIKNTVTGKGTIREALKDQYSAFEEAKADILGLFLSTYLIEKGELTGCTIEDAYVTFMAGLIRSVRFGATEAHGQANMMCLNYFEDMGAFSRNAAGKYTVNFSKMKEAVNSWAAMVVKFEGEGDYEGAKKYNAANGIIKPELQSDLNRLKSVNIPVDIVFEQGLKTLGIAK